MIDRMAEIIGMSAPDLSARIDQFIALLCDAVDSGASVGFLPPLAPSDARDYWLGVRDAVEKGSRILLAAIDQDKLVGSVQLDLASMPNGRHRAEVMKLFVHTRVRRQGIARELMRAIEESARTHGRTLLVLDTRRGDTAEKLYRKIGYSEAGIIPRYAADARGTLQGTVLFYRELPSASLV